jgi:hypothetical protein
MIDYHAAAEKMYDRMGVDPTNGMIDSLAELLRDFVRDHNLALVTDR